MPASILVAVTMRKLSLLLLACAGFLAMTSAVSAQTVSAQGLPKPMPLYNGTPPGALGHGTRDIPMLYVMLPKKPTTSAAMLVIPGGGYVEVALGHEGFQVGEWLRAQGMPAIVLDYRVAPYHYPTEIEDGMRAMRVIRAHAKEWGIDPNRIGVWGSSAGGHLASTLGTHCNKTNPNAADPIDRLSCKPDFMVLAYPVISMRKSITHMGSRNALLGLHPSPALVKEFSNELQVSPSTPPAFLFATERDPTVPVQNSIDFYNAMIRNHVPGELHIFDYSNHGCGLCGSIIPLSSWPSLLRRWMIDHSWLPPDAPPPPPPAPNWPDWMPGFQGPGMPRAK
jgi:acetyl esterase/lipase